MISARSFFEYIYNDCKDKICLIVSHDLDYIQKADQISILHEGEIIFSGSYSAICSNEYFVNNILNKKNN